MKSKITYDLLIIGGGISACVFASKYVQTYSKKKIALIEAGRGLGGRSSTRISKRFEGWELNHGAPNFNISNINNNLLLKSYIDELLEKKFIKIDDSDLVFLDDKLNMESIENSEFFCGNSYLSLNTMRQLSENIIGFNKIMDKIDFYFETLIVDLKFNNNQWIISSQNGDEFKSKYLILTSNLLLHKRSLEILNINQIPLRKAIPLNNDKSIDLILKFLEKQFFIPRLTFLIYTNKNYTYKDSYSKQYRYFYLKRNLENKYKFERIIFQQQNKKLGIVVHTKNTDLINSYEKAKDENILIKNISAKFNQLFDGNTSVNLLSGNEKMSIMKWRASQPSGCAVPLSLQFSRKYRIGFCGDWFEGRGFGRIEGSIMSSLKLVNIFNNLN